MVNCGSSGGSDSTTVDSTSTTGETTGTDTGTSTDTGTTTDTGTSTDTGTTTSSKATYTDVFAIIQSNCLNCHNKPATQGALISLTTHTEISFFASSIVSRINLSSSSGSFMPKNGSKLSTTNIAAIEEWIAEGKLDN